MRILFMSNNLKLWFVIWPQIRIICGTPKTFFDALTLHQRFCFICSGVRPGHHQCFFKSLSDDSNVQTGLRTTNLK